MRRVGLYLAALCVSWVALTAFWKLVGYLFGPVSGFVAFVLAFVSLSLFVVLTAWVYSVLATPKPMQGRRRQPLE